MELAAPPRPRGRLIHGLHRRVTADRQRAEKIADALLGQSKAPRGLDRISERHRPQGSHTYDQDHPARQAQPLGARGPGPSAGGRAPLGSGQLATNQLLSGGIGVALFSAGLYLAREVPGKLWTLIVNQLTVRLTIYNDDYSYSWINQWLAQHEYSRHCRRLQLGSMFHGRGMPAWHLTPGSGLHFL
jgi:hypothetical protein